MQVHALTGRRPGLLQAQGAKQKRFVVESRENDGEFGYEAAV